MKRYKFPSSNNFFIHYAYGPYTETHCHDYWEFTVVTNGKLLHKINGTERLVQENTLLVIRPDDGHSLNKAGTEELAYINLGVKKDAFKTMMKILSSDLYEWFVSQPYCEFEISKSSVIYYTKMFNLLQSNTQDKSTTEHFLSAIFISVIRELLFCINQSQQTHRYSAIINQFIEQMRRPENLTLSIEEIIQQMNYSHCHVIRLFKKETGMTPSQFFSNIKLEHARMLLESTNFSVANIASIVGFSSLGHFTKVFKERYSLPPANYRKKWSNYYDSFDDVQNEKAKNTQ